MNVARLLQDSPSDDHRRRQELREKHEREKERGREREDDRERERERERERDRERERGRAHEWDRGRERGREWGRERERAQRERSSMPSKPTAPPPTHRSYSPLGSTLPPQSRIHAYDSKPPLPPPPPRAAPTPNQNQNHAFPHSPGSDTMHARSYSQEGRPSSSAHSQMQAQAQSHSPPAPLFLSPLTAPREGTGGAAAGPEPETAPNNTSPEYSAEYAHQAKNAPQQTRGKTPPMFSRLERDREREYQQRTRSLSGSARPRTPPYGDYRDAGRITPTTARSGPGKHSPAQGSYSVVPPSQQSHQQHHFSPPLSGPLNNNNSSLHRAHPSQGPPLARRPAPPPASLPPPPSASLKHSHDSSGAPTTSAMGRPFDELPYPARAPSSSSSVMNAAPRERERTLKEDIERESLERERREKERERERERVRGREMQRNASSRSASTGASVHASPPNAFGDRVGELERDMVDIERMNREDMDAIRAAAATRMQSQPRDARERDAPRHHHHHHHHHALSHPHLHSHSSPNVYSQHQHQQQQQQLQSHLPGTPYTYAHTGKPRISRSGVLKLAPPGVTVPNNVPPSSSDLIFAGASGVVMRAETLTLAPASHGSQQQQQQQTPPALSALSGPQPIEPISVNVKQPSPPTTSLHLPLEMYSEGSQAYEGPQGYVEGLHSVPHLQQHPQQSSKHRSYSVVPTGPGVAPPNGGPPPPTNVQASMIAAQQQQQHAQQFGSMSTHQQMHRSHPHQQSLPPPPQSHPSSSSNGMHSQGPNHPHLHSSPYRHMSSGMPPQHQGYPPPPMHYNEVPPPPVPMALQPMPASPPMQELPPAEAPLHLGTFVFPHTPFPYFFPSRGDSDSRRVTAAPNLSPGQARKNARREADLATEQRVRPTHVTILIPSSHLPSSLPTDGRPRIWGGAPSSAPAPWAAYANFVTRPHTAVAGARRVYTDDSDIPLCALHSGRVSWAGMRRARVAGLDLAVRLAVHCDVGRYVGAPSAFADGGAAEGIPDVDVGLRCLLDGKSAKEVYEDTHSDGASWLMTPSASWESGHDGSGIEVLGAEWIPHGSTRKLGLRNRSQRLREYTERRRVIMKEVPADNLSPVPGPSTTVLGKRPACRSDPSCNSLSKDEEEISAARTVVFGTCREAESVGFKYDPTTIQSILFPSSSFSSSLIDRPRGRRKRRKLNGTNGVNGRTDPYSDADTESEFVSGNAGNNRKTYLSPRRSGIINTNTNRDVVLENGEARFLLALHDTHERSEEDKENRDSSVGSTDVRKGNRGKRYDLYALPAFSSLPVPPVSIDRPIPPKNMSATNGSGHARIDVETPMTPRSNASECGAGKSPKAVVDAEVTDENDAAEATTAAPNGTTSEPSAKTVAIPTPPATTETVHAPSPPPRSIDAAKDKGEYTKVPQILYRDLCAENVQFLDSGLSIAGAGRILENGAEKERKGMLIPVERWRWSGSRDSIIARSGSGREDIAGLGVS